MAPRSNAPSSAAFRLFQYPALSGSAAMLLGYFGSALRGAPRYDDPVFRSFLRRYQHDCLRLGKRLATRRIDEAQAARWREAHA